MLPLVTIITVALWTMINGAFLALMPLLIIFPNIFIMAIIPPVMVIGSHYDIIMYQMYRIYQIYLNIKFLLILVISMIPLFTIIMIAKKAICENAFIVYLLCLYGMSSSPIIVIIALLPLIVIAAHYDM
jgi:hypothetical protein